MLPVKVPGTLAECLQLFAVLFALIRSEVLSCIGKLYSRVFTCSTQASFPSLTSKHLLLTISNIIMNLITFGHSLHIQSIIIGGKPHVLCIYD